MFGFLAGLIGVHFRPDPKWPTLASDKYDIKGAGQKERSLWLSQNFSGSDLPHPGHHDWPRYLGRYFFFFSTTREVVRNHGDSGFKT